MLPDITEQQLTERLQAGDEGAFGDLFSRHRERLKRMVEFRMDPRLRGRMDASDILQEVFLDAKTRMPHYLAQPDLSFFVWLRKITLQRLVDTYRRHLKAERRDIKQEISIDQANAAATSASMARLLVDQLASPSQFAMRAELTAQLEHALNKLDPTDREVLALRHFEELRNGEVAEVLGLKDAAASNRYVRALSRLRDVVKDSPGLAQEN